MKIALRTDSLCLRGTDQAIHDYAFKLRNKEYDVEVWADKNSRSHTSKGIERMTNALPVKMYEDTLEIQADLVYSIEFGNDNGRKYTCPFVVHAVFESHTPYGRKYAAVSKWLAKRDQCEYYVPHLITLHPTETTMRDKFGILENQTVIARMGGWDSFDIPWVTQQIKRSLEKRDDLWYVLACTQKFFYHPRIVYLDQMYGEEKQEFINTADYLLHARERGETFGLTVAEFAYSGKHVYTYGNSPEMAHYELLEDKPHNKYTDEEGLYKLLINSYRKETKRLEIPDENISITRFEDIFLR